MNYEEAKLTAYFVNMALAGKDIPPFESVYQLPNQEVSNDNTALQVEMWRDFAEQHNKLRHSNKETQ